MDTIQRSIFTSLPGRHLLLDAGSCEFTIVAATRPYLQGLGLAEGALVGRGFFDVFPVSLDDPGDRTIRSLTESFSYVLKNRRAHEVPVFRNSFLTGCGDRTTAGYWRVINTPHLDDAGEVRHIIFSIEEAADPQMPEEQRKAKVLKQDLYSQEYWYLFNNNPDAAFSINRDGEFISANRALAGLLECTQEEIFERSFIPFVVPEDQERTGDYFRAALDGMPQSYQISVITAKGNRRPVQISNIPVMVNSEITGVFGVARDITELVRSQEQFQALVNTIHGIMWEADPATLQISFVSSQAEPLLGYSRREWMEHPDFWEVLIHPEDRDRVRALWKANVPRMKSFNLECRMISASGKVIWINNHVTVIGGQGKPALVRGIILDITESKRIQQILDESEDKYRNLIRNSLDGVYKSTPEGRFVEVNPALVRMLGYDSEEELLAIDIKKDLYFDSADRDSALLYETHMEMAEFRLKRKDGSAIWAEDHGQIILNEAGETLYHSGIIRDITERKKAEAELASSREALLRSNQRFTYAARATADAIWDWDLATGTVFREENFARITGFPVSYINSAEYVFSDYIHPDDTERVGTRIREAIASDVTNWAEEFRLRKADGTYAYVVDRGIVIRDNDGRAYRIIGAMNDISEQKAAEFEREQLIQTLTVNNKDLQQFSYITSHNLKAPLANLIGILGLLDTTKIRDEESLLLIDGLHKSASQLNSTVEDLVRILVIKEKVNIDQQQLILEHTWRSVENLTSGLIRAADAEVLLDFNKAPEVYFNNTYLESILLNLFSNALKYRSDERKCKIEISSREEEEHVVLRVRDNGLGIDLQRYDKRIFGLYQRFHNHPDSRGLGLYIIASQIKALGGKIEVESAVNEGTCFKVYFRKSAVAADLEDQLQS